MENGNKQTTVERRNKKKAAITKMAGIGIFSALAIVVALVCQVIPQIAGFLTLDAKDTVIAIASFVYGPMSSVVISLIAAFVELSFSTTGWYGFVMNFASSAIFSLTASLIYKYRRTLNGALIGFIAAIAATTAVMLLLNLYVTPLYFGLPRSAIVEMIPKILFPFNFAKSLMNAALAMMIYKPISLALKRAGLVEGEMGVKFNKQSVIVLSVGGGALLAAVVILLII